MALTLRQNPYNFFANLLCHFFCEDKEICVFVSSDVQILIVNVGFPIAISMYLLIRIEEKLQVLSDSINELSKNINVIKTK
ncbi:YvrJ family protein [Paraclostridium tenue]|uniref:YvrJ family protein n=1 Tax=Paraclostridium tenue TaxID=1737 RepID=A0ABP3XGJ1_9FIRM